jgi:hypothetical protein
MLLYVAVIDVCLASLLLQAMCAVIIGIVVVVAWYNILCTLRAVLVSVDSKFGLRSLMGAVDMLPLLMLFVYDGSPGW